MFRDRIRTPIKCTMRRISDFSYAVCPCCVDVCKISVVWHVEHLAVFWGICKIYAPGLGSPINVRADQLRHLRVMTDFLNLQ